MVKLLKFDDQARRSLEAGAFENEWRRRGPREAAPERKAGVHRSGNGGDRRGPAFE